MTTGGDERKVYVCPECMLAGCAVDEDECCTGCGHYIDAAHYVGGGLYTRAEVLAFRERVREACADSVYDCTHADTQTEIAREVRAVDVARLLEEDK